MLYHSPFMMSDKEMNDKQGKEYLQGGTIKLSP